MPTTNRTTRRKFLGQTLAGSAAALNLCGSATAAPPAAGRGYIDVHTHLGRTWNFTEEVTAKGLLRWMDQSQIAQAVVLPLVSPEASTFPAPTDFVLSQTKPHRDRLIPFCVFDPRTTYTGGRKGLVDILRRWADQGARGLGEHKPGIRVDDERNLALYAACGEARLPILFHLDNERNMDAPGLPGLEKVLKRFPEVTFIGHGPGWWASISGDVKAADMNGYPEGRVAPGGAIDRLMDKYPNIYGDLSAGSGALAITRDQDFGRQFLVRRADRLMFGTDYLSPGQEVAQLTLFRLMDLPQAVQGKIFRENAQRVLRL